MQSLTSSGAKAGIRACLRHRNAALQQAMPAIAAAVAGTAQAPLVRSGGSRLGTQGRSMGGLASKLDEALSEIPLKEAVRYKKGNLKWTRSDVKNHSDAFACGLLELGCKAGETIAMWLPESSEKHVAQMAAARIGMIVAEVDLSLTSAEAVGKILEESGATVVLVKDAVVPALREAVPELRHYKTDSGLPFRCSKLPSLRLCIHTGLDRETALLHFRSALLYSPPVSPLDKINGEVKESSPLHTNFKEGTGGAPQKSKTLSHADVMRDESWPTVMSILNKKYVEV